MWDHVSGDHQHDDDDESWLLELIHYNRTATCQQEGRYNVIVHGIYIAHLSWMPQASQPTPAVLPAANVHRASWAQLLSDKVLACPRTSQCFQAIESDPRLVYKLPRKSTLPGQVLRHVFGIIDSHLERHQPSIYKIGFTHNPSWRFYNQQYGYITNKDGWEGMTVLYASDENISPAFVEAAAIQKYKGHLPAYIVDIYISCCNKFYKKKHCIFHFFS